MSWLQYANPLVAERHREAIRGMIARDKNHPCIVMWSIANEPGLDGDGERPRQAYDYFRPLYELAHASDPQNRPVTLVCCQNDYTTDITERTMDAVCINRYYGWYNLSGDLDAACHALNIELDFWENIGKPVMFTELWRRHHRGHSWHAWRNVQRGIPTRLLCAHQRRNR